MRRLPSLDRDQLDAAQLKVHDSIAGPRGGVRGPFKVLLNNPELASRVEQLGAYVRYQCSVPQRLRELAILTVAAFWRADYEWFAHAPIALEQGIGAEAIRALGRNEEPILANDAERVVHAFTSQLLMTKRVDDATFEQAKAALGNTGVLDLAGLIGYYTLLALVINAVDVDIPADAVIPWRDAS